MEESELTKQEERRKRRESGEGEREIRGRGGGECSDVGDDGQHLPGRADSPSN